MPAVKKHLIVIALAIAALGAAATTKPATRRSGADRAAVRAAVTVLGKEFAAASLHLFQRRPRERHQRHGHPR
jgi:hypothetical protein